MKKILLLLLISSQLHAQVNIADKVTGNSYTAAEFNAIKNSIGITKPTVAAMLAGALPIDSTYITCLDYLRKGDGARTKWLYSASSTATANSMTVYTASTGRYILVPEDNEYTVRKLGIDTAAADNSTPFAAMTVLAVAAKLPLYIDRNTTIRVRDVNLPSGLTLKCKDSTAWLNSTSYTQLATNGHHCVIGNSGASQSSGVILDGVNIRAGVSFANDTVNSTKSTVSDSFAVVMFLSNTPNWLIKNSRIGYGGVAGGIYYVNSPNLTITNTLFDSVGSIPIFNFYDSSSANTSITYCTFQNYALRRRYDPGNPVCPWRNGEVATQGGGRGFKWKWNKVYNSHKWFIVESRHIDTAEYSYNTYYSNGINSGGYSVGGIDNAHAAVIIKIGNVDDVNTKFDAFRLQDSLVWNGVKVGQLYYGPNFDELFSCKGLIDSAEVRHGYSIGMEGDTKDARFSNNYWDNVVNGSNIFMQAGSVDGDSTVRVSFNKNKVLMGDNSRFLRLTGHSFVDGLSFNDSVTWVNSAATNNNIMEVNLLAQKNISFKGVWTGNFSGGRAFSINNVTTQQTIDISGANFSNA